MKMKSLEKDGENRNGSQLQNYIYKTLHNYFIKIKKQLLQIKSGVK